MLPEATYGAGTLFGARAVLAARATSTSVALDEVTAWQIPKATLQSLLSANPAFCAAVFADIARRLSRQEGAQRAARVPVVDDGAGERRLPAQALFRRRRARPGVGVRLLAGAGQSNALVRDGRSASACSPPPICATPCCAGRRAATATGRARGRALHLVTVHADAELFDALLMMIRHRVHRVLVRDGEAIVGVLSQLDLMSFVSNHSHLIALQVEQADRWPSSKAAALQMDGLIALLHGGGVKVEVIIQPGERAQRADFCPPVVASRAARTGAPTAA